jgi:hypothetical protein
MMPIDWIQMSILVVLVISLPLVFAGVSKQTVGVLPLIDGAIIFIRFSLFVNRGSSRLSWRCADAGTPNRVTARPI